MAILFAPAPPPIPPQGFVIVPPWTPDLGVDDGEWGEYKLDLVDITRTPAAGGDPGTLAMECIAFSEWFETASGPLLYRGIAGNFSIRVRVRARRTSSPGDPPNVGYQFGGVMIHDPRSDGESQTYSFVVVGHRGDRLQVEWKRTIGGSSIVAATDWANGDAEVRLDRVGTQITYYARPYSGGEWQQLESDSISGLPDEVEIGLIAYSMEELPDLPDLTVTFDSLSVEAL